MSFNVRCGVSRGFSSKAWRLGIAGICGLMACNGTAEEDTSISPLFGSETIGGDRPAEVVVPSSYDGITPMPLLFLLHGYSANAELQDVYFRLSARAEEDGFLLVLPNGTLDQTGTTFWNSFPGSSETVDDVGYLMGLLDEMEETWRVDSAKVYFLGHSNGGYMSYRLACEHADRITGILNLAGLSPYLTEGKCKPSEPVSMLHVHGVLDERVPYESVDGFPGAEEVTALWVERNGCEAEASTAGQSLDLVDSIEGDETTVRDWSVGCSGESRVSLWTINAGGHTPFFNNSWSESVVEWLSAMSK
jgi:polyhydroxybutyrate depolymerase